MPKADATGLAPNKSADIALPHSIRRCRRVWFPPCRCSPFTHTGPQPSFSARKIRPISLVESPSGGLGLKTRRPPGRFCRALRFRFSFFLPLGYRSCLYKRVSYPTRTPHQPSSDGQDGKESEKQAGNYADTIGGNERDPLHHR